MIRPIIFSPLMVQAILDGRKTQTRRVIKPHIPGEEIWEMDDAHIPYVMDSFGPHYPTYAIREPGYDYRGMALWVRETFFQYKDTFYYKADNKHIELEKLGIRFKWRPSIHMPRAATRIFLRVTDMRAERLNDINEEDSLQEGIIEHYHGRFHYLKENMPGNYEGTYANTAKQAFMWLWNAINTKRGFIWASNPWVWAYTLERIEKPMDWPLTA